MEVGFGSGDTQKLLKELPILKPSVFGSFPAFFNSLYKMAVKGGLVDTDHMGNLIVKNKKGVKGMSMMFGGRINMIVSGGAPLSQLVFDFLKELFQAPIIECYGATECCGGLTCTFAWEKTAGLVGGPLACVKMKLVDRPDLGYLTTDEPPRGELYVKGNSVFKGYFRRPD